MFFRWLLGHLHRHSRHSVLDSESDSLVQNTVWTTLFKNWGEVQKWVHVREDYAIWQIIKFVCIYLCNIYFFLLIKRLLFSLSGPSFLVVWWEATLFFLISSGLLTFSLEELDKQYFPLICCKSVSPSPFLHIKQIEKSNFSAKL